MDDGGGLPDGWSHNNDDVYENVHTTEQIAWRPSLRASKVPGNAPPPPGTLPDGWIAGLSASDELNYTNEHTGETVDELPTEPASRMLPSTAVMVRMLLAFILAAYFDRCKFLAMFGIDGGCGQKFN